MYFRRIFQKPLQYSVKCSCKAFTQVNRSGVLRAGFPSTHTKLGRRTNITWFWQGRVCQFAACVGAAHPLDTRHILSLCSIETVLTAKSGSGGEVWAQKTNREMVKSHRCRCVVCLPGELQRKIQVPGISTTLAICCTNQPQECLHIIKPSLPDSKC